MEKLAYKARKQTEASAYFREMEEHGITDNVRYGSACFVKKPQKKQSLTFLSYFVKGYLSIKKFQKTDEHPNKAIATHNYTISNICRKVIFCTLPNMLEINQDYLILEFFSL